jgi:hypothetical protein
VGEVLRRVYEASGGWSPGEWLLAQDAHFAWGLAITFGVYAAHLDHWFIPFILLAELLLKEAVFDQIVERSPLWPDGFVDWSFYVLGAGAGYFLLHL